MQRNGVNFEILGDDLQAVEITLDPGQTVISEAGGLLYMHPDITFEAKMDDGSNEDAGFFSKIGRSINRAISGETLFLTHFTNNGSTQRKLSFAAPIPGKIVPIDMSTKNGSILCQSGAFLTSEKGNSIDIAFTKKFSTGFFGGEGFILQRVAGGGFVFLQACGTVIKKELNNEKIVVDTGAIVAFDESLNYSIQTAGSFKSMLFGGEGLFLTTLEGSGEVYLQSLPFKELAQRIVQFMPEDNSSNN